jgi:glycosyltransferase involved in cell wall biosynthesis
VFICQAVDLDDPVLATTVRWLEALARKPSVEHVTALALRTGRFSLPPNVEVHRFGGAGRIATLARFFRALGRSLRPRPHVFFVFQGGHYPLLLMPFKLALRVPIVQWKTHPVITRAMRFYARWCDDLIFTAARASFPIDTPKRRVVGHGIDTDLFSVEARPALGELVTTGRLAGSKRIDQMVRAVVHANRAFGTSYRLNVYGAALPGKESYASEVEALIGDLGASEWVALEGAVPQEELPGLLNGHRACLNFSNTGIDKAVLEAMACGLPVVTTNDSTSEILPSDLRPALVSEKDNPEAQAGKIHELLQRPDSELAQLGERLRAVVEKEHGVDALFDRILEDIEELLCARA